jgi:hypothetical protein
MLSEIKDSSEWDKACARLLEQLLGRDSETVGDLCRAVQHFQHMVAQRAAKLARSSVARVQLDPAEAGAAFGANHVAFFHAPIMPRGFDRSKTPPAGKAES